MQLEDIQRKLKELPPDSPERQILAIALKRIDQRKLLRYNPYPWQREFHDMGRTKSQRLIMAANGVGKTLVGAAESAIHLSGQYPKWWKGRRFDRPVHLWVGSISNQTQRDYTQPALFGANIGEALGTGFIPGECLDGRPRPRQAGIGDVVDIAYIRHVSGKNSTVTMKTYEQGWRMWQGAAPDIVWLDEQPDETAKDEKAIFSEVITRIFRSSGMMYATLTPLLGETDMIRHFMTAAPESPVWWRGATWDDAPHLKEEDKAAAKAAYGEHEIDVRTQGVPMMGSGRVFTMLEGDIKVPPKKIPDHWARIVGIDFGVDHPAALAELAWDRDADVLYLVRTWRQRGADVPTHVDAIRGSDPWIPIAWPHDGLKREPGVDKGLKTLVQIYREAGASHMLGMSARYKNDTGGAQPVEPIVLEMQNRMRDGGFKVFDSCPEFFDEYRSYHRDDNGKIVPLRDDVIKAVMYGVMMRRYAKPKTLRKAAISSAYDRAVL
jgi:phage terminase large subunit-like protein